MHKKTKHLQIKFSHTCNKHNTRISSRQQYDSNKKYTTQKHYNEHIGKLTDTIHEVQNKLKPKQMKINTKRDTIFKKLTSEMFKNKCIHYIVHKL